jgi:hypothetical protein
MECFGEACIYTSMKYPFNILEVTPEWERICGYRQDDIVGKTCQFLQGAQTDRSAVNKAVAHAIFESKCTVRVYNYKCYSETPFLNELTLQRITGAKGDQQLRGTMCEIEKSPLQLQRRTGAFFRPGSILEPACVTTWDGDFAADPLMM